MGLRALPRVLALLALLAPGLAFAAPGKGGPTVTLVAIKASPVGNKLYVKLHTNGLQPPQFAAAVGKDARRLQVDLIDVQAGTAFAASLRATRAGLNHVTVTQIAGQPTTTRVILGLMEPVDRLNYRILPAGDTGDIVIQFDALLPALAPPEASDTETESSEPQDGTPSPGRSPARRPAPGRLWSDPLVLISAALLLAAIALAALRRLRGRRAPAQLGEAAERLVPAPASPTAPVPSAPEQAAPPDLRRAADLLAETAGYDMQGGPSDIEIALRQRFPAEALLPHLREGSVKQRTSAAALLRLHPTAAVAEALLQTAASARDGLRAAALTSLAHLACTPAVHRLLAALAATDEPQRAAAREALQQAGSHCAPVLRRELSNPDAALRAQAVEALLLVRSGDSARAVVRLLDDPSPQVRAVAARALGALSPAEAEAEALLRALEDNDEEVRNQAGLALARLGGEYLGPLSLALARRAEEDLNYHPSEELLAALAAATVLPVPEYAAVLSGLDRGLAQGLAQALARSGTLRTWLDRWPEFSTEQRGTVLELLRAAALAGAVDPVLEGLNLPHAEARQQCLRLLAEVAAPAALGSLRDLLTDPDEDLRAAAIQALGRIGNQEAREALTRALQDPSVEVRAGAARGLRATFLSPAAEEEVAPEVVTALSRAGRDASVSVRAEVAGALGAAGTEPALHALVQLALHDGEEEVRTAALEALAASRGYRAVPAPLLEAVGSEDPQVRTRALQILSHADDPTAVATMVSALQDADGAVRATAGRGLWEAAAGQQWQFLLQYLQSPDPKVRAAVIGVLGKTRSSDWAGTLAGAVSDPSPAVRAAIMNALSRMGEAAGLYLHAIIAGLGDTDAYVRARAAEAAPQVAPRYPGMAREVLKLARDPDPSVRTAVVTAAMEFARLGLPEALIQLIAASAQPEEITPVLAGAEDELLRRLLEEAKQSPLDVSAPALETLSQLVRTRWTPAELRPELASLDSEARLEALDCLALLQPETTVRDIAQMLETDPSPRVRARAARLLRDMCARLPEAWEALQRAAAADPDEIVRGFAEEAVASTPAPPPPAEA